jgi:hypothetical protein
MTMIFGFANRNREGIYAESMTTSMGKPITLTAYAQDRGNRRDYEELKQTIFLLGTEWILHQGPARPDFSSEKITGRDRAKAGEDLVRAVFYLGSAKVANLQKYRREPPKIPFCQNPHESNLLLC